jgi:hypothetical protein
VDTTLLRVARHLGRQRQQATAVGMLSEMGMAFWLPEAERELVEAT